MSGPGSGRLLLRISLPVPPRPGRRRAARNGQRFPLRRRNAGKQDDLPGVVGEMRNLALDRLLDPERFGTGS